VFNLPCRWTAAQLRNGCACCARRLHCGPLRTQEPGELPLDHSSRTTVQRPGHLLLPAVHAIPVTAPAEYGEYHRSYSGTDAQHGQYHHTLNRRWAARQAKLNTKKLGVTKGPIFSVAWPPFTPPVGSSTKATGPGTLAAHAFDSIVHRHVQGKKYSCIRSLPALDSAACRSPLHTRYSVLNDYSRTTLHCVFLFEPVL
jgi:hypothetical protein